MTKGKLYLLATHISDKAPGTPLITPLVWGIDFRNCRHSIRVPGASDNRSNFIIIHVLIPGHIYPNEAATYQVIGFFSCSTRIEYEWEL